MKIIAVVSDKSTILKDKQAWQQAFAGSELLFISREVINGRKENIIEKIKKEKPELLIVENLEGFDMRTLTDAVAYNLIHCRQIHLLDNDKIWKMNESALEGQLSLNMFFMCEDEATAKRLEEKYNELPYIQGINGGDSILEAVCKLSDYIGEIK